MKIQYCSDLHLEFPENSHFMKENPIRPVGDVLILAGDIIPFHRQAEADWFFDRVSDEFQRVYWLPGNHEYYYADINESSGVVSEAIRDNVFLVNNHAVYEDGFRLLFTTLWTSIGDVNRFRIQQALSDFQVIKDGDLRFNPDKYNALHQDCLDFLGRELEKDHPVVVITHHVPTFFNYPEKYRGDFLNEAFAVELEALLHEHKITHWIFGHHHCNIDEFQLGNTSLLTNQLGYVKYGENERFELDNYILIN